MNRARGLVRPAILAAGAVGGLLVAHAADYRILIADPVRRQELLTVTGHGWLPQIESVAVACAVASVAGAIASGLSGRRPRGAHTLGATMLRIAAAQSIGFVAMELGERLFAGAPLHHLTPVVLGVGVLLQIVTGAAVAGAVTLLAAAGARLVRAFRHRRHGPARAPRSFPRPAARTPWRTLLRTAADPVRGPPVAFAP